MEIWASTGATDTELGFYIIDSTFENFLCGMRIDDTIISYRCLDSGLLGEFLMAPRCMGAYHIHQGFYSWYFRGHGLKYQNILLPTGLLWSVCDTSHNYNDMGAFNMNGLEDCCLLFWRRMGTVFHILCWPTGYFAKVR